MISNGLGSFANLGGGYGLRIGGVPVEIFQDLPLNQDQAGFIAFFISLNKALL